MNFIKKWYTYQKERFPVLVYGIYILAIVFATFCFTDYYGRMFSINNDMLSYSSAMQYTRNFFRIIPMFIVCFLQFLMVRIIDEFKDYDEDCKYRPYRPVPRGLITLKELKILFIICSVLQLLISILVGNDLVSKIGIVCSLLILWVFFAIMSKGFFIKKFLDKHMLIEVLLDELLMPILILYLANINLQSHLYIKVISEPSFSLLLIMSYVISWIVEVARKVRCKEDEENGVRTYTAVFGISKAVLLLFLLETALMQIQTAIFVETYISTKLVKLVVVGIYVIVSLINLLFSIKQNKKFAKLTELSANMHILIAYFSLALLII